MRVLLALFALTLDVSSASNQAPADASVVLQDLAKYSKLYVSYENCAWSTYETADGAGNACGVAAGDATYWYMGLTECLRANVAYSLYGVETGKEDKGCTKATYINSFFSTTGVQSFTQYLTDAGVTFSAASDGSQISSDCAVVQNANGDDANNNAVNYNANNVKVNAQDTSYGVGCAATGTDFVSKKYGGAYCDERSALQVTDSMKTFNNEIGAVQCMAIYDVSADGSAVDATGLLQYSSACDVRVFPDACPDPYGMLKSVASANAKALSSAARPGREIVKTVFTWFFLCLGVILMFGSALAYHRKQQALKAAQDAKTPKKGIFGRKDGGGKKANASTERQPGFLSRIRSKCSRSM